VLEQYDLSVAKYVALSSRQLANLMYHQLHMAHSQMSQLHPPLEYVIVDATAPPAIGPHQLLLFMLKLSPRIHF
jgi:hypothetical protein